MKTEIKGSSNGHGSPDEKTDRLEDTVYGAAGYALAVAFVGSVGTLAAQFMALTSAAAVICAAVTLPALLVALGSILAAVMCDVRRAGGVRLWWAGL
jgi:hypothetical protein